VTKCRCGLNALRYLSLSIDLQRGDVIKGLAKLTYVCGAIGASVLIAKLVKDGITSEVDTQATRRLQQIQSRRFRAVMEAVSWPGFPPQSRILPLILPTAMLSSGRPMQALFQLLGWGTGLVSGLVKRIVKRPRPDHPEITVTTARVSGSSFPSGHVIIYTGVYGFLAYLAHIHVPLKWLRWAIVGGITALIALVGPSRMYLGHHWLSDVTVSYLLGSSYLVALTAIYSRVLRKRSGI
jgi:PAP2 superfamily